jgi:DNA-binding IclR family transcriptional regulator
MDSLPPATRRRGIQSVEIGMRVLSALAGHPGPATLSAVAQGAGLSASQAHRYLSSLIAAGVARQEALTGLYDLDAGAIRIGLAALARLDIFASADLAFSAFARETGRTCLVAVWGDSGPTVVRWYAGFPPVITSLAIGSVMPLLRSATGQVFFAFGDPAVMDAHAVAERGGATPGPDLAALRSKIRAACLARVQGDLIPGLRAIGAPVFDLQGRLVLAATTFANGGTNRKDDAKTATALKAACRRLTEGLGGRWPLTGGR